jgi:endonuclease V-like protein UPF0215 family
MFKSEIRILGFDDGAHEDFRKWENRELPTGERHKVPVIGVIFRGGSFLDGALRTDVTIDGLDSTDRLIDIINRTRHKRQLRVIMLDGVTFGGFNIIDIQRLNEETGLPVIVFNRKMPDLDRVRKALKNFEDYEKRWELIEKAGDIKPHRLKRNKNVYFQNAGLSDEETKEIIDLSSTHGQIPEPLRVAHMIATAIVKGESTGRA